MTDRILLFRSDTLLAALPIRFVEEILRPLPVAGLAGVPDFVLGSATVRGRAVPVLDLEALLTGMQSRNTRRWISARPVDERRVALAVRDVIGVVDADVVGAAALPPLLRDAAAESVTRLGQLDGQLVALLELARVVPVDLWSSLDLEVMPT